MKMHDNEKVLEGIVTTINEDGTVNISPIGPVVREPLETFLFRPYPTSTTYQNLVRQGEGVFHITDDVELLARSAVGRLDKPPALVPAPGKAGYILRDACRWFSFKIISHEDSSPRANMMARVVNQGEQRPFFGFNRAKHSVVEAAILATRIGLLSDEEILRQCEYLAGPVKKTGGAQERRAFLFLRDYLREQLAKDRCQTSATTKPSQP